MEQEKKRSPYQLLWEWAGAYHGSFYAAVIFAVLGVACSMIPYFCAAGIIRLLLEGCKEINELLPYFGGMLGGYAGKVIFSCVSTGISHKATYATLQDLRKKLIAGFWDVTGGSITLGGTDIRKIPFEQLNGQIAYVSQENYLFDRSVRENIRMGNPNATDKKVEEAERQSGCDSFIRALENGYDTVAGGGGGHLSGGEKQRISIARALLKDAPIVILDEATASVDPENEKELQEAIDALTQNKTIIMIAHRLKTVRHANQILVLDNGHIVQQGTHEELAGEPGLYYDFLNARKEAVGWKVSR
jgi:ABC-type multidrug transport system fused ATPase/permease subunit